MTRTAFLLACGFCLLVEGDSWAAATLKVGKASGKAGETVGLPIALSAGAKLPVGLQFSLTLPVGVSTVSVTPSAALTPSKKIVRTNLKENSWAFVV